MDEDDGRRAGRAPGWVLGSVWHLLSVTGLGGC